MFSHQLLLFLIALSGFVVAITSQNLSLIGSVGDINIFISRYNFICNGNNCTNVSIPTETTQGTTKNPNGNACKNDTLTIFSYHRMQNKEAYRILHLIDSIYKYTKDKDDTHRLLESKNRIEKSFSSDYSWSVVPVPNKYQIYPMAYDKNIVLSIGCMYKVYITALKKCLA